MQEDHLWSKVMSHHALAIIPTFKYKVKDTFMWVNMSTLGLEKCAKVTLEHICLYL